MTRLKHIWQHHPRPKMPPRSLAERVMGRLRLIALKLNRHVVFSNRLRMFIYRHVAGMDVGEGTAIWADNRFNVADTVKIGRTCVIGPGNVFLARGGVEIGDNVNISGFSFFLSQTHDARGGDYLKTVLSPIKIEDHVWIATHAMILPGVSVGQGAVVAAGAVVTKNVEPWTIVAGNPARVIGQRDPATAKPFGDRGNTAVQWI